jgi:hypothetical protein
MELTPEERQKIYLEEKTRLEIQRQVQSQQKETGAGTVAGRTIFGILGLVVLLVVINSIIGNSDTGKSPSASTPNTGNAANDRLLQLDADARAAALGLIVVSSGDRCRGTDAFFMGLNPKDNEAYWSVRCTNTKSYEVAIKANETGSTSVVDCDVMKAFAKVSCFVKLEQQ